MNTRTIQGTTIIEPPPMHHNASDTSTKNDGINAPLLTRAFYQLLVKSTTKIYLNIKINMDTKYYHMNYSFQFQK